MVQAGVLMKVAMAGIQPCSSRGVSARPAQNIPWVWLLYSLPSVYKPSSRLSR